MRRIKLTTSRMTWAIALAVPLSGAAALATPRAGNLFVTVLNRATAAKAIHTVAHSGSWNVVLQTNEPSDFLVQYSGYVPGGYTGWHSHPGPVLVTVKRGTATWYEAPNPGRGTHERVERADGDADPVLCPPHDYPSGSAFVEPAGVVHTVRNESSTEQLELLTTYIVPVGVATRQDESQPAVCPDIP
jgi:quercetin dioxygenase-like cupin family protein